MAEVGQLLEVILYVEDMTTQVGFYRDTLGLKVKHPLDTRRPEKLHWVELETGPCTLALHGGGQRRFGADAPKIVFGVKEVAVIRDDLLLKGVSMGEIRFPGPGIMVCGGIDPEGNRFSIESHDPVRA